MMSVSAAKPGPNPGPKPGQARALILLWAALAITLGGVIVWAAIQVDDPLSHYVRTDKMRHILAFGAVGLCAGLMPSPRARLIAIGAVAVFALAIEIMQIPVPDRNASLSDLFASLVGGFAGFGFGAAILMAWDTARGLLSSQTKAPRPAP